MLNTGNTDKYYRLLFEDPRRQQTHARCPDLAMQLGCSFFQNMAAEFGAQDYGSGLEQWFRPAVTAAHTLSPAVRRAHSSNSQLARAVLIDMEPKVGSACQGVWVKYGIFLAFNLVLSIMQ